MTVIVATVFGNCRIGYGVLSEDEDPATGSAATAACSAGPAAWRQLVMYEASCWPATACSVATMAVEPEIQFALSNARLLRSMSGQRVNTSFTSASWNCATEKGE